MEDWGNGTKRDPVYSYTRQMLTGETIQKLNPSLYKLMEELQTELSLIVGRLESTDETFLKPKDPSCYDISVLAAIPSKSAIPK